MYGSWGVRFKSNGECVLDHAADGLEHFDERAPSHHLIEPPFDLAPSFDLLEFARRHRQYLEERVFQLKLLQVYYNITNKDRYV